MREAMRGYLSMANGLTEVPRRRATAAAKALLAQGGAPAEQVSQLTDQLMATSRSNREALSTLIRYEVDRTLDQMGLVTADKLRALTARVATLETEVRARSGGGARVPHTPATRAPAKKAPAKKAPATRAPAAKAAADKAAKKTPAKRAPAKNAATTRAGSTAAATRESS